MPYVVQLPDGQVEVGALTGIGSGSRLVAMAPLAGAEPDGRLERAMRIERSERLAETVRRTVERRGPDNGLAILRVTHAASAHAADLESLFDAGQIDGAGRTLTKPTTGTATVLYFTLDVSEYGGSDELE